MIHKALEQIESGRLRKDLAPFTIGDQLRVITKITEGEAERLQPFEGTVIARKGGGLGEMFTVRRVTMGVGIERIFPLNSPRIVKLEVIRAGRVRRAKLYYLRKKIGRAARLEEKLAGETGVAATPTPAAEPLLAGKTPAASHR